MDEGHGKSRTRRQLLHGTSLISTLQEENFSRDQSGMKHKLGTLQKLISVMDPELYRKLGKWPL